MRLLGVFASIAIIATAAPAHADDNATKAKALFDDGRKLIEAADKLTDPAQQAPQINAACDKFAESLTLDAQLGTKLNLADCRVRQGKLVDAYALFADAAAEAERTHDRESFAKQQVAALEAKIVRVTLHVTAPANAIVSLDTRTLTAAELAKAQVVAPGPIVVDVRAPGFKPLHIERPGEAGAEVAIDVPALQPIAVEAPPPVVEPHRSSAPYFIMGFGGVLELATAGLGLHARLRYDTARDNGDKAGVSGAQREADIATVCAIAGAVALVTGFVWYWHDKSAAVTITPDHPGVALLGWF